MPLVDIEEVESRCPYVRYGGDMNAPRPGDTFELVRLFHCLLLGEMLRDGEGCGPFFTNGACTLKCPVPHRLGEPGYNPRRERYIRRVFLVGLRANVRDGWHWNKARRQPEWSHEWTVAEAVPAFGAATLRKYLNDAIIEGLEPGEAQRLKNKYAPLQTVPDEI